MDINIKSNLGRRLQRQVIYDGVEKAEDVNVAAMYYNMIVVHRRLHPTRKVGCEVCENFLDIIPNYFGLESVGLSIKQHREAQLRMKEVELLTDRKKHSKTLIFGRRRNGRAK